MIVLNMIIFHNISSDSRNLYSSQFSSNLLQLLAKLLAVCVLHFFCVVLMSRVNTFSVVAGVTGVIELLCIHVIADNDIVSFILNIEQDRIKLFVQIEVDNMTSILLY